MQIQKGLSAKREYPLVLAPMAELSHRGLRELICEFGGCSLFFTEMISASGLVAHSPFEKYYTDFGPVESMTIAQLTGSSAEEILEAMEILLDYDIAGVDINMGCSAPEITRRGGGSAWLYKEEEALYMLKKASRIMPDKKSLSVKLRLPFDIKPEDFSAFLQRLCDTGIDFITIHPKTTKEKHDRPSRWQHLEVLLKSVNIPVIANGNISDTDTLLSRIERYKPDAVMIGRKAVEAPWFFSHARAAMDNDKNPPQVNIKETGLKAIRLIKEYQPEEFWLSRTKRFFLYYNKNLFWGHKLFMKIKNSNSLEEIEDIFTEYFYRNPEEEIK